MSNGSTQPIDPKSVKRIRAYDEETEFHDPEDTALAEDREIGDTARKRNHGGLWFRKLVPPGTG